MLKVKIISMGEAKAGKSCLIKRCKTSCIFTFNADVCFIASSTSTHGAYSCIITALIILLYAPPAPRYCEEKFINKYIGTIGVDYGVKPLKLGNMEVSDLWSFLAGVVHNIISASLSS